LTKIIAFAHRRRVGKDTAAKLLDTILRVKKPGIRIAKLSFAAKLKDICHQLFGWAGLQPGIFYEDERNSHLRETILPKIEKSPRQLWIEAGNKMREIYSDVWLDYMLYGMPAVDVLIISDLRFRNEATKVHSLGGQVIKLVRDSAPVSDDTSDCALDGYIDFDKIIENHGDMHDLHSKMETLSEEILEWLATD
jgi:hypothetical protein